MSYYSLWIDTEHAFVYKFSPNGIEETKVEAHGTKEHGKIATDKFYHELAQKLMNAKELVIMGPGIAKDQFKHHCENHHHQNLAKAIVGMKVMQAQPTKAMMLEKASEFFENYHNWTKNY